MSKTRHLDAVDLSAKLDSESYQKKLGRLQDKLMLIQQAYLGTHERAMIVFEGWDAAGKGGTIRCLSSVLDPRGFKVWPIAAPTPAEQANHYLHRFWTRLPAYGEISVFDRSWYGRVLVERVEGFAKPSAWRRAYDEINEFEALHTADGARILKIFLHVSADVQRERFIRRIEDPLKRWKLTYEDIRNWRQRPAYEAAIEEMLERTSTKNAPWHVVSANDKQHARVESLKLIADCLGKGIDTKPKPVPEELYAAAREHLGITLGTHAGHSGKAPKPETDL